jgi:hypothetical protein
MPIFLPDLLDRRVRRGSIELHRAAGEVVRVEVAEHELRVGHGRNRAAAAIADRPGKRACALRPDRHRPRLGTHLHQASAARADRLDVHLRQEVLVLVSVRDERIRRSAAVDDRHVERSSAHVGRDHVRFAHGGTEEHRRRDTGHRTGIEREQRCFSGARNRHRPAAALRDLQRRVRSRDR